MVGVDAVGVTAAAFAGEIRLAVLEWLHRVEVDVAMPRLAGDSVFGDDEGLSAATIGAFTRVVSTSFPGLACVSFDGLTAAIAGDVCPFGDFGVDD